jgi:hypothetical protein
MRNSRLFLTLTFVAGAIAQTGLAQTTTTITRNFSFPPVGLASGDTMEVNLVNLAANPANSSGTAASCSGNVSFFNAAGTAIGTATTFTVAGGVTQSVSLPFSSAGISAARGEVRAVIQTTTTATHNAAPCSLTASLEVFDSTGTHVYLSSAVASAGPVPVVIPVQLQQ